MEIAKAPATAEEQLSLQARLDQIEAGVDTAHKELDRIQPRDDGEDLPVPAGAQAAAARCQQKLAALNQRLINVGDLVGSL